MYEIRFDKKALEEFNKLERRIKERVWNKLKACKEDPFHFLEHLENMNGFKLRVGDYRVIVDVDKSLSVIYILRVGHRKNIYEK